MNEEDKEIFWYKKDGKWYSDKGLKHYIDIIKVQEKEIKKQDDLLYDLIEELKILKTKIEILEKEQENK